MPIEKAKIVNTEKAGHEPIEVMFNPPSLKLNSSNSYADLKTPGGNQEQQQYIKTNPDTLTVELFFDTTRQGKDVTTVVNPIIELTKVSKATKEPPKLIFAWGEFSFPCVITSVDHLYDYFNSSGQALRAMLTVKFRRCEPEEKPAEPVKSAVKKVAQKATKTEVVKKGDNIMCFCVDPKDAKKVCELNGINNGLTMDNRTTLEIPVSSTNS
jgi:phage protein U